MNSYETFLSETQDVGGIRNATVISGALIGGTTGIVGGVVGAGVAALVGALVGAVGGVLLERQARRDASANEDVSSEPVIEPPRVGGDVAALARRRNHSGAHLHYAYPQSFAVGSMFFRPGS